MNDMSVFVKVAPVIALIAAICGLAFAMYKFFWVKSQPEGTKEMANIASKVRKGAMAYLKRQYKTVGIFFIVMLIIICIMAACGLLTWFVPFTHPDKTEGEAREAVDSAVEGEEGSQF